MSGNLYIVGTPIGNLDDITFRAIDTLKNVDIIFSEDTRHTIKLLNHFNISKPLISYYKQKEKMKSEEIINLLKDGKNIAIVSDAGTPAISDPGEEIVRRAIENSIKIVPIPGACALILGLITSGFNTKEFIFLGFIDEKKQKDKFEEIKYEKKTIIIYEAPHRIKRTLNNIREILGDRNITIGKELTKIHEEFIIGKISDVIEKLNEPKGEYVITIEGSKISNIEKEKIDLSNKTLEEHYEFYKNKGFSQKEIIKQIAKDRKQIKNDIYKYFLNKE